MAIVNWIFDMTFSDRPTNYSSWVCHVRNPIEMEHWQFPRMDAFTRQRVPLKGPLWPQVKRDYFRSRLKWWEDMRGRQMSLRWRSYHSSLVRLFHSSRTSSKTQKAASGNLYLKGLELFDICNTYILNSEKVFFWTNIMYLLKKTHST